MLTPKRLRNLGIWAAVVVAFYVTLGACDVGALWGLHFLGVRDVAVPHSGDSHEPDRDYGQRHEGQSSRNQESFGGPA